MPFVRRPLITDADENPEKIGAECVPSKAKLPEGPLQGHGMRDAVPSRLIKLLEIARKPGMRVNDACSPCKALGI